MNEEKLSEMELYNNAYSHLDEAMSYAMEITSQEGQALAHMIYGAIRWLEMKLKEEKNKLKVVK